MSIDPPALTSIVIMKIGTYAGEPLKDIVARKQEEERSAGCFYWGYGGTLCQPLTQVQPFAEEARELGATPVAVLIASASRSALATHQAAEHSIDHQQRSGGKDRR